AWEVGRAERVGGGDGGVRAVGVKILGEELVQWIVLGIRPEMCVEPGEMIGGRSSERRPDHGVVRIQDGELCQELLGLSPRIAGLQQRRGIGQWARDRGYRFVHTLAGEA